MEGSSGQPGPYALIPQVPRAPALSPAGQSQVCHTEDLPALWIRKTSSVALTDGLTTPQRKPHGSQVGLVTGTGRTLEGQRPVRLAGAGAAGGA